MDIKSGDAAAIIEAAREGQESKVITIEHEGVKAPLLLLAKGNGAFDLHNVKGTIDAYRANPERRTGTAKMLELASFIDHANRFKDDDSAIFVSNNPKQPSFLSVLDYHEAVNPETPASVKLLPPDATNRPADLSGRDALPRFGVHRGSYTPEFSDEWKLWTGNDAQGLSQASFAALIEKGARDISDVASFPEERLSEMAAWYARRFGGKQSAGEFYASSETMLALAEGLTITVEERVIDVESRNDGRKAVAFDSNTRATIDVPVAFLLALPIFRGGDLYEVPVRLRFFVRSKDDTKRLEWRLELYGADRVIAACVAEMGKQVKTKTGLPLFVGSPEA